jgi:hypothetical protein
MDIEHLNKTQIVLLTLLISFVTSIATGIATVSLIEKAPADVTRVISRIIEQPIETILPGEKEIITQTVVVQESDLIAQAVATMRPSLVRVYKTERSEKTFIAFGVVVDTKGTVVADALGVPGKKEYTVTTDEGNEVVMEAGEAFGGVVLLTPKNDQNIVGSFTPVRQVELSELKLGQTVVALGSSGTSLTVSPGIISEIQMPNDAVARGSIRTTITSNNIVIGSPLMTTKGEVIGISPSTEIGLFLTFLVPKP